jgi:hypothetical protein
MIFSAAQPQARKNKHYAIGFENLMTRSSFSCGLNLDNYKTCFPLQMLHSMQSILP